MMRRMYENSSKKIFFLLLFFVLKRFISLWVFFFNNGTWFFNLSHDIDQDQWFKFNRWHRLWRKNRFMSLNRDRVGIRNWKCNAMFLHLLSWFIFIWNFGFMILLPKNGVSYSLKNRRYLLLEFKNLSFRLITIIISWAYTRGIIGFSLQIARDLHATLVVLRHF